MINGRLGYAIYIETAGPGVAAQRMQQQIEADSIAQARDYWSGQFTIPQTTVADVIAALGTPDQQTEHKIAYRLPLRSGYLYTFVFDRQHHALRQAGYQRDGRSPRPPAIPTNPSQHLAYRRQLATIGATAAELHQWLGDPLEVDGWWPIEVWHYPTGLTLELRHGIVEEQ